MGVDVREDDVGRSDTLMVATVDPHTDQTTLLSIPRDTRVRIYGYGFDKINAAYAYGGEPLTEKTVENLLGIDIDHYVMINVRSFVKIIDAIGGVDIYVPKRMYTKILGTMTADFTLICEEVISTWTERKQFNLCVSASKNHFFV